jgi:hypothetical protein
MSIADTSDNGNVKKTPNSANSPISEQANCPFYSVLNDNEHQAVTNLPLLNPANNVDDGQQQCEYQVTENPEDNQQQDWIAEPDSEQQAVVNAEFQQLLTLNQELQKANSGLYAQVEQLKQELAEAEKILQWQKKRSSVTDSMVNQQAQDLASSQEQIQSLFQQLEAAVQTVQNQEMYIQTHKSQLQISQERVAQLERECTLLQTKYGEQGQKLLHSENTCRELRTRLIRQQRQTLQFKAALEKCLDSSIPHYDTLEDKVHHPDDVTSTSTRFSRKARSLFPNAQPIKPWSAEPNPAVDTFSSAGEHLEKSWMQPPSPSVYTPDYYPVVDTDENLSDVDHSPEPDLKADEYDYQVAEVDSAQELNLDRQLESLIEMFFASSSQSSPQTSVNDAQMNNTVIDSENEVNYETLGSEMTIDEGLVRKLNDSDNSVVPQSEEFTVSSSGETQQKAVNPNNQDYWASLPLSDFNLQPVGEYHLDHQSPSPLIYPQRPPKGRKSFASVELPKFSPPVNGQKPQKSNDH